LSGEEAWKVCTVLNELTHIRKAFVTVKDLYPSLFSISQDVKSFASLAQEIQRCVNQDGEVLDDASINIAAIRREKVELQKQSTRCCRTFFPATPTRVPFKTIL